jgi:hypothetical protein
MNQQSNHTTLEAPGNFYQVNGRRDYSKLFKGFHETLHGLRIKQRIEAERAIIQGSKFLSEINQALPDPPDKCPHCGSKWNDFEKGHKECLSCGFPEPWDKITDDDVMD